MIAVLRALYVGEMTPMPDTRLDDRVVCVLGLEAELERLTGLCASAERELHELGKEHGKLGRKLKKHGRYWSPEKRVAIEAQLVWLGEQVPAAERKAAELEDERQRVEQELAEQMDRLTARQRGQLAGVKLECVGS